MLFIPKIGEKPFSFYNRSGENLEIFYQKKGCFTTKMTELVSGEKLLIRGPYGKEIKIAKEKKILFVAGGTGIAAAKAFFESYNSLVLMVGARSGNRLPNFNKWQGGGCIKIYTDDVRVRMDKIVSLFVNDIVSIRTGRATPGLIENVVVTVYGGQKMRLIELGSISVPDVRSLTFQPWDQGLIREISNGIAAANVGMNPVVDGQIIRMSLPMLTVEQREDYVKLLGRKLEAARVMIRDARADFRSNIQKAKQDKTISEDEFKKDETELQKLTDEFIKKLEGLSEKKELEIRG
jgi:ribosome recycling factor